MIGWFQVIVCGRQRGRRSRPRQRLGQRGRGGPCSGTVRMRWAQRRTANSRVTTLFRSARFPSSYKFHNIQFMVGLTSIISRTSRQATASYVHFLSNSSRIPLNSIAFSVIRLSTTNRSFRLRRRFWWPMRWFIGSVYQGWCTYADSTDSYSSFVTPGIAWKLTSSKWWISSFGTWASSLALTFTYATYR